MLHHTCFAEKGERRFWLFSSVPWLLSRNMMLCAVPLRATLRPLRSCEGIEPFLLIVVSSLGSSDTTEYRLFITGSSLNFPCLRLIVAPAQTESLSNQPVLIPVAVPQILVGSGEEGRGFDRNWFEEGTR